MKETAKQLGGEMKIPGFRKGKVPPEMVEQRLGPRGRADRGARELARRVVRAGDARRRRSRPSAIPKLDLSDAARTRASRSSSRSRSRSRPKAKLGDYKGLEVGRAEPEVPAEAVDAEIERLREGFAKLNPVDRESRRGRRAPDRLRGHDRRRALRGRRGQGLPARAGRRQGAARARAGADRGQGRRRADGAAVSFPDDYQAEEVAGKQAEFKVKVKEVREKELPELDDDFAAEASEFDTLDELREHISERIQEFLEQQAIRALPRGRARRRRRQGDGRAARSRSSPPAPRRCGSGSSASCASRGWTPSAYLQMQGKTREELIAEARPDASRALKREAVLRGRRRRRGDRDRRGGDAGGAADPARPRGPRPSRARGGARGAAKSGRDELLREDLRMRRALEMIAEEAKPIPLEQAEAREQIWTPEKEREEKGGLWTPGSGPAAEPDEQVLDVERGLRLGVGDPAVLDDGGLGQLVLG